MLAYGRVAQILKSVASVLESLAPSPSECVLNSSKRDLERLLSGFKHRFTTGAQLTGVLHGVGGAIREYGSLNACFTSGLSAGDPTVLPALELFTAEISRLGRCSCHYLLPAPSKGSACKRLNLYLRWMVRSDEVDPGGWKGVSPSLLVVPLDTHMHRAGTALGLTSRGQATLRTALEITEGFRRIAPEDPVRYDFSLTRLGIRSETSLDEFLQTLTKNKVSKQKV